MPLTIQYTLGRVILSPLAISILSDGQDRMRERKGSAWLTRSSGWDGTWALGSLQMTKISLSASVKITTGHPVFHRNIVCATN
jgi:hypothetical protein